jgi:hypothetical protein
MEAIIMKNNKIKLIIILPVFFISACLFSQETYFNNYAETQNSISNEESKDQTLNLIVLISQSIEENYNTDLEHYIDNHDHASLNDLIEKIKKEFVITDCFDVVDIIFHKKDAHSVILNCNEILNSIGGGEALVDISLDYYLSTYETSLNIGKN